MEVAYRLKQALRALVAFRQPADEQLAARHLGPEMQILFNRMRHSEQLHGLNVLRDVLDQEPDTPDDLAVAALLHDAGKSRYAVRVWQKTIAVIVMKLAPERYRRWSADSGEHFWTRPFVVKAQHPQWGAALLAGAGGSERAIWLVAHHQDDPAVWEHHPYCSLLRRLQRADDVN